MEEWKTRSSYIGSHRKICKFSCKANDLRRSGGNPAADNTLSTNTGGTIAAEDIRATAHPLSNRLRNSG
jgi:hypothetical protein